MLFRSQTLSETHSNTTCGQSNGSIDITVNGGTSPFTYSWSNAAATQDLNGIPSGSYTVTVTDNNGCTATLTINISDAPAQTLTETHTNTTCGQSNGSIDITVNGGTSPYTYNWSNAAVTQDLNGIPSGSYTVTVTDNNGCTATLTINISDAPAQTLTETHSNTTCGQSNGSIDITVNGGTSPYTYNWSNAAATQDLNGIPSGSYTVTVTDNNGCTATLKIGRAHV